MDNAHNTDTTLNSNDHYDIGLADGIEAMDNPVAIELASRLYLGKTEPLMMHPDYAQGFIDGVFSMRPYPTE